MNASRFGWWAAPAARAEPTRWGALVFEDGVEVFIQNPNRYSGVRIRVLRPWLTKLLATLAPDRDSFALRIVSDREMREINRTYRDIDRSTDVLSFPGSDSPEGHHLGDVVIALPTARLQAQDADRDIEQELKTLILHGVLHCMGHDHETDRGEMVRLERRLRKKWVDHHE